MFRQAAVVLLAVLFDCSCAGLIPRPPPKPNEIDVQWFFEALRNSDHLELLEGVPHPLWEPEERENEISKHPTTKIAKEIFYSQRLVGDDEFKGNITSAFLKEELFVPPKPDEPISFKQCGGFHADYGLQWLKEDKPLAAALVCFGCNEILIVGNGMEVLADMTEDGREYLAGTLRPLHGLRPPFLHLERLRELKKHLPQTEKMERIKIQLD